MAAILSTKEWSRATLTVHLIESSSHSVLILLTHWHLAVILKFQTCIKDRYIEHSPCNCPEVNTTIPHWWLVNIVLGDGLVQSGSKPLPEQILTNFCDGASPGHNELTPPLRNGSQTAQNNELIKQANLIREKDWKSCPAVTNQLNESIKHGLWKLRYLPAV